MIRTDLSFCLVVSVGFHTNAPTFFLLFTAALSFVRSLGSTADMVWTRRDGEERHGGARQRQREREKGTGEERRAQGNTFLREVACPLRVRCVSMPCQLFMCVCKLWYREGRRRREKETETESSVFYA